MIKNKRYKLSKPHGAYLVDIEDNENYIVGHWDNDDDKIIGLLNFQDQENKKLKKENLDLSEELDYYKTKCASLETRLFQADKESEQLKSEINMLKTTIGRNEAYIQQMKYGGEWR